MTPEQTIEYDKPFDAAWKTLTSQAGVEELELNELRNGDVLLVHDKEGTNRRKMWVGMYYYGALLGYDEDNNPKATRKFSNFIKFGHVSNWKEAEAATKLVKSLFETRYGKFFEDVLYSEDLVDGDIIILSDEDELPELKCIDYSDSDKISRQPSSDTYVEGLRSLPCRRLRL